MNGLRYFNQLGCKTWQDAAEQFDLESVADLIGDTAYDEDIDVTTWLFDCIMLDELAAQHKQYLYDQTHFTEGVSI